MPINGGAASSVDSSLTRRLRKELSKITDDAICPGQVHLSITIPWRWIQNLRFSTAF